MKVTSINKSACIALRSELNAVLAKFGAEANLDFAVGNMKFTSATVDIKLSAVIKGAPKKDESALLSVLAVYGLKQTTASGTRTLVEFNRRRYAYPFVYTDGSKRYKCSLEQAKRLGFGA